jgi:hypothetical protein
VRKSRPAAQFRYGCIDGVWRPDTFVFLSDRRVAGAWSDEGVMSMRKLLLVALAAALLTSACGASSTPASTPLTRAFCALRTAGNAIVGPSGDRVVLHGANLPSIREIEASGGSAPERVAALAAEGAAVIRMAVIDEEVTPSYVPDKLLPVVIRANEAGVVLILSWRNDVSQRLNKQASNAEDVVRLLIPALRGFDGVWLDPINEPLDQPVGKRRAVAARMIDVARGLGDQRIILVNDADWLRSPDPDINKPFEQPNIVYGVDSADALPGLDVPLFVTAADGAAIDAALKAGVGSAAASPSDNRAWTKSIRCR